MGNSIYIVDQQTQQPIRVAPVSFAEINIKERADLETWVINHPEILGEELLVITSEFAKFDRSSKRLDVLALDKHGVLVVIELKLDAAGSLADQQAIRHAAFCSTMTMEQVVETYATYHGTSEEEGGDRIAEFLEVDERPELNNQPRIILAAGSIDDQELTACVIWLRRFGVDISCVELTPYRLPGTAQIILVPRVIIPLPEARDFIVKIEQKEVAIGQEQKIRSENEKLWQAIGCAFNALGLPLRTTGRSKNNFMQIPVGRAGIHYEWLRRKREQCIDVAIHFESDDMAINQQRILPFEARRDEIERDVGQPLRTGLFGKKWTQVKFSIPYSGAEEVTDVAPKAASLMKTLIERTLPTLEGLK